jgi:hypothetical protein
MTQIITISLNEEAEKIIEALKEQKENISEIVCNLLIKKYKVSK